jgi:DNA-binding transcriptional ArsR family regulator
MPKRHSAQLPSPADPITDQTFELAAELFSVLSAPIRLRIIKSVCDSEKNVSDILKEVNTTQPNMSQHLNTLYKAGILGKRREGVQMYYRVIDPRVTELCHAVCSRVTQDDVGQQLVELETGH